MFSQTAVKLETKCKLLLQISFSEATIKSQNAYLICNSLLPKLQNALRKFYKLHKDMCKVSFYVILETLSDFEGGFYKLYDSFISGINWSL